MSISLGFQSASAQQATVDSQPSSDTLAIQEFMLHYHQAIVSHDGASLSKLFLPDANLWLNVLTDTAYGQLKAPETQPKIKVSSFQDFARFISTSTKALDPQHSHETIRTDGTIATVYFDFIFLADGKAQNRGSETWQMVHTRDGWKIAAMLYSSNPVVQH